VVTLIVIFVLSAQCSLFCFSGLNHHVSEMTLNTVPKRLVSWSLTSLFSTNMAKSETKLCLRKDMVIDFGDFCYKIVTLYKSPPLTSIREKTYFNERVINVWKALPGDVDFTSLSRLRMSILKTDLCSKLYCS